jgi:hypothetical protein
VVKSVVSSLLTENTQASQKPELSRKLLLEPCFSSVLTERGGFEPPEGLTLQQISSLPHSTALPPLQVWFCLFFLSYSLAILLA